MLPKRFPGALTQPGTRRVLGCSLHPTQVCFLHERPPGSPVLGWLRPEQRGHPWAPENGQVQGLDAADRTLTGWRRPVWTFRPEPVELGRAGGRAGEETDSKEERKC